MSRIEQDRIKNLEVERSFESLFVELSTQFISLPPDQIDAAIEAAQRRICEVYQLDCSTLWQRSTEPDTLLLTHIFAFEGRPKPANILTVERTAGAAGVYPEGTTPPICREIRMNAFSPRVRGQMQCGRTVVLSSLDDLPPEAASDRELIRQFGAGSAIVVPLGMGPDWLGCLIFTCVNSERTWSSPMIKRFELVAHLFGHALARRSSEQMRRENEAQLGAILDMAVEGIITMDSRGVIESVNAAVTRLFGYPANELIGQNVRILMPTPYHERHDQYIGDYLRTGTARIIGMGRELVAQRKDGSVFRIELAVSESIVGERRFFTGFVRDITQRIATDQATLDFSGRLINAQEEERARVARELHDDISQRLARLAIDVGRLQGLPARKVDEDSLIAGVREELVRLSDDVHAISYELHPSALVDLGLDEALQAECERLARQESIAIEVKLRDLPAALPRDKALGLFRIAQESIRNAVRHGRAASIELTLRGIDCGLQLAVRDDGMGFDPARNRHRPSLGLASMSERARLLGGELDIESEPGHGTTVVVWVPLAEKSP